MAQLKITLIRSPIGRPKRHKRILISLGLTKVNKTVVKEDVPQIQGMIKKVPHLLRVEKV